MTSTTTRIAAAALLLMLATGCDPVPTAAPAGTTPPLPAAAPAPVGDTGTVTRVIDGDTFEVGPRTIRVLGIDSCEADTDAGDTATGQARTLLLGRPVTLRAEPGVDTDRNDRELRYVGLADGADFGTTMVAATHTAVYAGDNDASPASVAQLRAADPNGRVCEEPAPTTTTTTTTRPRADDDDDADIPNVPDVDAPDVDRPTRRTSSGGGGGGRVGRDGDGDGLCNESTVPVPC